MREIERKGRKHKVRIECIHNNFQIGVRIDQREKDNKS